MTKKAIISKGAAAKDKAVKNVRRKTRRAYSSNERTRILSDLHGEESIAVLCEICSGSGQGGGLEPESSSFSRSME